MWNAPKQQDLYKLPYVILPMYDTNRISNYNWGEKYTISSQIFNCLVETKKKKHFSNCWWFFTSWSSVRKFFACWLFKSIGVITVYSSTCVVLQFMGLLRGECCYPSSIPLSAVMLKSEVERFSPTDWNLYIAVPSGPHVITPFWHL